MNRYPLWKYIVIAIALVAGLIYAVPNLFPDVPAVQVSSSKTGVRVDPALLANVEDALKTANIAYTGATIDETGIKARFADTDTQIKARDLLQGKLGENYIVALNLLSTSPRWLASIGALPMYLGLDLRGGVHFLLQVDMKGALDKASDRYTTDIRSLMRSKKVQYSGVSREGGSVVLRFKDEGERNKARVAIETEYPDLAVREQEGTGETRLIATLKPEAQKRIQDGAVQQNITILRNRVNELGVAEPIIQQQGADRVVVQLPGVQDTARAKDILGRTATLEIRMLNQDPGALEAALQGAIPFGSELLKDRDGSTILVRRQVVLTGDRITDAQSGFDQIRNKPAVHVTLDGAGARIFKEITRENVGKRMAVVLIEKGKADVLTSPVINEEIGGGRVQISGGTMSTREANDIALLMRAGALAAPMEIVEERTVGPSLGKENIEKGFDSVLYGLIALSIFICLYYQLMGVISTIALYINLLLLVAILSLIQASLTLPGMAAIALTLGMAIDANVLINERIREELRWGATPHAAIQAGYERAWNTILDSNVTTLIAGIALLIFGSGPVRGFAVVHCIGILTSMFSAVFVSRGIVALIYGSRKRLEKISIGQVWRPTATAAPAKS
jgi:preprotein translocase subunit SecD